MLFNTPQTDSRFRPERGALPRNPYAPEHQATTPPNIFEGNILNTPCFVTPTELSVIPPNVSRSEALIFFHETRNELAEFSQGQIEPEDLSDSALLVLCARTSLVEKYAALIDRQAIESGVAQKSVGALKQLAFLAAEAVVHSRNETIEDQLSLDLRKNISHIALLPTLGLGWAVATLYGGNLLVPAASPQAIGTTAALGLCACLLVTGGSIVNWLKAWGTQLKFTSDLNVEIKNPVAEEEMREKLLDIRTRTLF